MKKNSFLFLFILSSIFFSGKIFAQTASIKEELVLTVSSVDAKNYDEVKNAITGIDGISFAGYCQDLNYFLLYFDTTKLDSDRAVAKAIETLNPLYRPKIILKAYFTDLLNQCKNTPFDPSGQTK